jgi:hypothetical protein
MSLVAGSCRGGPGSPPQPLNAVLKTTSRMHIGLMASLERKLIFQGHADEYGHSEIIVVEEGA